MKILPTTDKGLTNSSGSISTSENIKTGFSERMKKAVKEVNQLQHTANQTIEQTMQGNKGIHEAMLAIGKADISLKLLLQVRSKAIEAYKEIMHMPV